MEPVRRLLDPSLGALETELCAGDPSTRWADSGAMALTGRREGPALPCPRLLPGLLDSAAALLSRLTGELGHTVTVDGPALLGERAALAGLCRAGATSCGGATRLLRAADGWVAVALPRDEDWELVPAWLARMVAAGAWGEVGVEVASRSQSDLVKRARWCGVAVAALGEVGSPPVGVGAARCGDAPTSLPDALVVVDLSSLWAGPLCAQLLGAAGARVVKVESTSRPDGARSGPSAFFDLLHAGHESVALDFDRDGGRDGLRRLLHRADVVIEGSRPRALHHLGVGAEEIMGDSGPRVWLSITGFGRYAEPDRVAFGDDAAVAGGLVAWEGDEPRFCGDAAADPIAGLVGAVAVCAALMAGGRWLLDAAMARIAALAASPPAPPSSKPAPPRARAVTGRARDLGADTDRVLAELVP
jgi:hypothetical protein